jgi:uncharacterized membrane protein YphA (DoxX/SURF4 family)
MIRNKYVLLAFRLVVGAFFVWAGALKVIHPLAFVQDILDYRVFSQAVAFFLGLTMPWVELVSGLLLMLGLYRRASALIISALLASFIILIVVTMARGLDLICGCLGPLSGKVGWKLVGQDVLLLLFSLIVFFSRSAELSLDGKLGLRGAGD